MQYFTAHLLPVTTFPPSQGSQMKVSVKHLLDVLHENWRLDFVPSVFIGACSYA